jgi:hypothetical protein
MSRWLDGRKDRATFDIAPKECIPISNERLRHGNLPHVIGGQRCDSATKRPSLLSCHIFKNLFHKAELSCHYI